MRGMWTHLPYAFVFHGVREECLNGTQNRKKARITPVAYTQFLYLGLYGRPIHSIRLKINLKVAFVD